METSKQLNLFQWDLLAVGKGYQCFCEFNFNEAGKHFANVLSVLPSHTAAGQGMRDLEFWKETFSEIEVLDKHSRFCSLWERITSFSFGSLEWCGSFRLSLIRHLLELMEGEPDFYHPPDLCRGYLALQLGDFPGAEKHLRRLLQKHPENGRLYGYLADALWMQGRLEAAWINYVTALLLSPDEVAVPAIRNKPLVALIDEKGPAETPIYGFLRGLHPLVAPLTAPRSREAMIYGHLYHAEEARRQGNHAAMVAARRELKALAPEIMKDYLVSIQK